MFTRSDFEADVGRILATFHKLESYPGLHYALYPQYAFAPPDGENRVQITRAPRAPEDNGLWFWLSAERIDGWTDWWDPDFRKFVERALFRPLTEIEFNTLIATWTSEIISPPKLPLHAPRGFVGALLMFPGPAEADDLFVSAVAEYGDEFLHFSWGSTA